MNNTKFIQLEIEGIWVSSLNFKKKIINNLVKECYNLEKNEKNISGRTFQHLNGYHSGDILNYNKFKIIADRIHEILNKDISSYINCKNNNKLIDYVNTNIQMTEMWVIIWRKGDINNIHIHPNTHFSGAFYLKASNNKDNKLLHNKILFPKKYDMFPLPEPILESNNTASTFNPVENLGYIFRSNKPHYVNSSNSDEDRISIGFNAIVKNDFTFQDIRPKPDWIPYIVKYKYVKSDEYQLVNVNNILKLKIKNSYFTKNYNGFINVKNYINYDKYINKDIYITENENDDYFTSDEKYNDDYYLYKNNNSDTLFIIFSGMGFENKKPIFIFNKFLKQFKYDKLFLRDLNYNWFLNGLGEYNSVEKLTDFIKSFIKERHKKIVTIGCSVGGYASILYGHLLKVNKCLAFSPQTVINDTKKKILKDNRWDTVINNFISKINDKKYLDLKNFIPFNMKTSIYYSDNLILDKLHALRLEDININFESIMTDTHLIALELKKTGKLLEIIKNI